LVKIAVRNVAKIFGLSDHLGSIRILLLEAYVELVSVQWLVAGGRSFAELVAGLRRRENTELKT
jgi:hypothetical protein